MKWFAIEEDDFDGANVNGIEITDLRNLLASLRNQWRDDHEVYTVEVMFLFGQVIVEVERLGGNMFEYETSDDPRLLDSPVEIFDDALQIGDLVMRHRQIGINPPVVGRVISSASDEIIGVRWSDIGPTLIARDEIMKVGKDYERYAPRDVDANRTTQ